MHDKPSETLDLCARHCLIHLAGSSDPVRVNGTIREVMGMLFPDILAMLGFDLFSARSVVKPRAADNWGCGMKLCLRLLRDLLR